MTQIMLVEDSPTQAIRLQNDLNQHGWSVDWHESAEDALDAVAHCPPAIVICDQNLPGMSGQEFCRRLRMNVDTRGIPVLILTAGGEETGEQAGLDAGADDYLAKTADPEILALRIAWLLRKAEGVAQPVGATGANLRRASLLLVDDSATYLEHLRQELAADGYSVDTASSGAAALDQLAAHDYDGVLVDLVMPGMDGIELCRRLVALRQQRADPLVVLMLTARESKTDMTRGLEAGADDFVGKSSDISVLRARIRALLRRKFFQAENRRIAEELQVRELQAVRARAAQEAAEAQARLAGELEVANRELHDANRQLKEAQSQLVQREKMASLGQLVAGIAHEINNPLAFVINNHFTVSEQLATIHDATVAALDEDGRARLQKAETRLADMRPGLDRVRELVSKLRTFSRLDEGQLKTVDVGEGIDAVLTILKHRLKEAGVEVITHFEGDQTLACFAGELNQVIMNIVANAIDASDHGGRIDIRTYRSDGMFVIAIADRGHGIPADIRHRIFEPFFTTKAVGKGTGLGLSISYGIVARHGGRLEVESSDDGTTFAISLPEHGPKE